MPLKTGAEEFMLRVATAMPPLGGPAPISAFCYHGSHTDGMQTAGADRFSLSASTITKHFDYFANSDRSIFVSADLPTARGPAAILTFDDNLKSHTSLMLPLLTDFGLRGTFYLSPDDIGKEGQLAWIDVEKLVGAGMEIGAHNATHRVAASFSVPQFKAAVLRCREFLEAFNMPLTWAYPGGNVGSYQRYHERILIDEGFSVRFSSVEGVCRPTRLDRPQRRYVMRNTISARYFVCALSGGLQAIALMKWLRGIAYIWRRRFSLGRREYVERQNG